MTILDIITMPDPILRKISEPVEYIGSDLRILLDDMLETMYDAPGIGLAGIQVAVPKRVLVIDVSDHDTQSPNPICMINPEIIYFSDEKRIYEEGCLSLPDVRVEIERPTEISVRYINQYGTKEKLTTHGLLATAIQHEIDHLDGRLIIDFLSKLRRDIVIRKLKKTARTKIM
ncbi:MAG: Peptide deformylase 1 [Hyphomicrobiaceae bacterium hypho_1]